MTEDLMELAERCEAANGPDRELDRDIMLAAIPCDRAPFRYWAPANEDTGCGVVDVERVYYAPHCAQAVAVPKFTASLDAAMTLVPEGWGFKGEHGLGFATAFTVGHVGKNCLYDQPEGRASAATPALALCAAALRARAQSPTPSRESGEDA